MKFTQEFREAGLVHGVMAELRRTLTRPWVLMEICGGQTHAIMHYGLDQLLPPEIELVHGPGCPVCVTALELVDKALAIASQPGVIFCSYGDMLRVPGSGRDLFSVRAAGGDVRVVYSPLDAIKIAQQHPKQVVFFAIGFETTAPANAMSVLQARALGLSNFSILTSHVCVPPAMHAILGSPHSRVQGFLLAGHVCAVMGYWEYEPLAARYGVPMAVTGFEPLDIAQGILGAHAGTGTCGRRERLPPPGDPGRQPASAEGAPAGVRTVRPQVARHWYDPDEWVEPAPGVRRLQRRKAFRRRGHPAGGIAAVHRRAGAAGVAEAARLPGVWRAVHPRAPIGRHHGLVRGRLRRLLPL